MPKKPNVWFNSANNISMVQNTNNILGDVNACFFEYKQHFQRSYERLTSTPGFNSEQFCVNRNMGNTLYRLHG